MPTRCSRRACSTSATSACARRRSTCAAAASRCAYDNPKTGTDHVFAARCRGDRKTWSVPDFGFGASMSWLDEVPWNEHGLIAAVAQDFSTGKGLTVAWMNRDALLQSVEKEQAVYWSRSRNRLWRKGEESGHVQKLRELRLDCDADAVLLRVEQVGGIACHTGRESCFFRKLENG